MAYVPPPEFPYQDDSAPGAGDGDVVAAGIVNDIMAYLQDELPIDIAAASGTSLDHGTQLTGLLDDDHTQYALADGSRGTFEAAGAVAAHTADTTDAHDGSAISLTAPPGTGNLTTGVTDVQTLADEVDALELNTYSDENARDAAAAMIVAGEGITLNLNDVADSLEIAATARGIVVIDSTEGYADVPVWAVTGDIIFRRSA